MTPADPLKWFATKMEEEERFRQAIGDEAYEALARERLLQKWKEERERRNHAPDTSER